MMRMVIVYDDDCHGVDRRDHGDAFVLKGYDQDVRWSE